MLPPDEEMAGSPSSQIESLFAPPSPSRNNRNAGNGGGSLRSVLPAAEPPIRPAARESSAWSNSLSVGKQLLHARLAHGWTIEDVAFQTHIAHTLLREMENDDLSNFANLTYAKSFLKLYSRHLGLDLTDYLDQFDTSAISAVTGHEYIQTASLVRSLSAPAIAPDAEGNPRARLLLASIAVVAVALVAFVFHKFSSGSSAAPADQPQSGRTTATETVVPASSPGLNSSHASNQSSAERPRPTPLTANRANQDSPVSSRPVSLNLPPKAEVIQE